MSNDSDDKQVSQKAEALQKLTKGMKAGALYAPEWKTLSTHRLELTHDQEERSMHISRIWDELHWGDKQLFVRACPLSPRAGVLESSVANSLDEMSVIVNRIMDTMLGADPSSEPLYEHGLLEPDGCIIVQPYIDATASAVVSPTSHIVMARDNDGVTAGKDGLKVALRHTGVKDHTTRKLLDDMEIDPTKIELEFVSMSREQDSMRDSHSLNPQTYIVQLRGAEYGHTPLAPPPAGVSISGFVTGGTITVKEVYTIADSGDEELARLEQHLRENDVTQTAFIHAESSSLSHHAGQCRKYSAGAYINSDSPRVGDTWVECASGWVIDDPTFDAQPFEHMEYVEDFKRGVTVGLTHFSRQYGWLSNHFHQYLGGAPLMDIGNTAYLAGVFTGYLPNAIMAVSLGELRHATGQKKNLLPIDSATLGVLYEELDFNEGNDYSGDRKTYYATIEKNPITPDSITGQLKWMSKQYATGWSGGYGGTKYQESTDKGVLVMDAIKVFGKKPTKENLTALLGAVNDGENIVHNNGFFLDKFISQRAFDIGTDMDNVAIIPKEMFSVYYSALDAVSHKDDKIPTLYDNTEVTTFAMKYNAKYTWHTNNPLFQRSNLPAAYLRLTDLHKLHYNSNAVIPCGHTHCEKCKSVMEEKLHSSILSLKINTHLDLDMSSPTQVDNTTIMIDAEEHDIYYQIFTKGIYESTVSATVLKCLNTYLNVACNNPAIDKLRKHYSYWLAYAPHEYRIELQELAEAMNTQEE